MVDVVSANRTLDGSDARHGIDWAENVLDHAALILEAAGHAYCRVGNGTMILPV